MARSLLSTLAGLLLLTLSLAAAPPYFQLRTLSPGVYAALDVPGSPAGSNAGFIVGTRRVLVVDTFESAAAAQALLEAIHRITPLPIAYVVNTHYHLDHVNGNQVFADAGAVILAQRFVPDWIHTENLKFFGPHPTPAQRARVAALRAPDLVYDSGIAVDLGGRIIQVRVEPGHTGGDSIVVAPPAAPGQPPVVFTGDLFWGHDLPNLIDASTVPMLATLAELVRRYPAAVFVPGHGTVGGAADVSSFRAYIVRLRTVTAAALARGLNGSALVAAEVAELRPQYGAWGLFAHFAPLNAAQTAAELRGRKRLPPRPSIG